MKENEIMIDDWVYIPFMELMTEPKRKTRQMNADLLSNSKALQEISPIPLTEKILEVNGFKKYQEGEYAPYYYVNHFSMRYHNVGKYFYTGGEGFTIRLDYVHQLQQTLRLCGLNNLANNFKIE